jgi:hypothetical protein
MILHINFVKTCLKFGLRPKFIAFNLHTSSPASKTRLEKWLIRKWLDMERRQHYAKKAMVLDLLFRTQNRLASLLSTSNLDSLLNHAENHQRNLFNRLRREKHSKISALCKLKDQANHLTVPAEHLV